MAELTIVFADLTGSTGLYETLGNTKAADVVSKATQWMGKLCTMRGGKVIKYLGDGVLISFDHNLSAVHSVIEMQNMHFERIKAWPDNMQIKIKVGMARGEVVEQDGDCFGDAVNVASRLCDLGGPEQIFVTQSVVDGLPIGHDIRSRNLGAMIVRGRAEPLVVQRVEWHPEVASEFLTIAANLDPAFLQSAHIQHKGHIELSQMDVHTEFHGDNLPIFLGRGEDCHFVVQDPRVSRIHAKIDRRGDSYILEDMSSYGSWVRFAGDQTTVALRRQECILHGEGEIALGVSFDDFSVSTVNFKITSGGLP